MAQVTIPYADPGKAAFETLDSYANVNLLNGSDPALKTARGVALPNNSSFPQFAVLGLDGAGKLAWATEGDAVGVKARGVLTFSGTGTAADQITVGARTYTLVAALTAANQVLIGGSAAATATNFMNAINGDPATAGVTYHASTLAHADVSASSNGSGIVGLAAQDVGVAGNAIATTETGTNTSFGAATLTGGLDTAGVKARFVLSSAASLGASGTGNGECFYSGHFNQDALVWHASFTTDAQKQSAFDGSPTPTTILVSKR